MKTKSTRVQPPSYRNSIARSSQPEHVFQELAQQDWAFTCDNTTFLTHDLHPYPAKFIPQIPGTIISRLSKVGDTILDPFGGSGTTALEAVRLGRRAISMDANPIAELIGRAKTTRLDKMANAEISGLHSRLREEVAGLPENPSDLVQLYSDYIPVIPNRSKWYPDTSCGELALIKARISELESSGAVDIALLTLSRIALKASFQDSETRYKSVPREIGRGKTIYGYLAELEDVRRSIRETSAELKYGIANFITADVRNVNVTVLPAEIADLVVTSPPYGNAHDYHLYHRFRLLWLGFDPKILGDIEIGSHLKHQRKGDGFDDYIADMSAAISTIERSLKPGCYAALVIGSSIYSGRQYDSARAIEELALKKGFDASIIIDREIHNTRRSFAHVARRAKSEGILLLRKIPRAMSVILSQPNYKPWPYEHNLRARELEKVGRPSSAATLADGSLAIDIDANNYRSLRRLVFSRVIQIECGTQELTWQAVLENGTTSTPSGRKDPKYVTHGLHPYKGKFYPQLAKGLINLVGLEPGDRIFDPFCGSGTTLLEGYLNGYRAYGIDMNPLAVLIARAKTRILETPVETVSEAYQAIMDIIDVAPEYPDESLSEFPLECQDEIKKWFAPNVYRKLNWLLKQIRKICTGALREYMEAMLSSIVRDVSQQEPSDLRIRYRKVLLEDADVYGMFTHVMKVQYLRLEKFWSIRGHAPAAFYPASVIAGDSRIDEDLNGLKIADESVDLILTSPPYATALPYIDTDRLSLLTLLGLSSSKRRPVEYGLIGSRELSIRDRAFIMKSENLSSLPAPIEKFIIDLERQISVLDTGFRRKNMPALLTRFFCDMTLVLRNCYRVTRPKGCAMIVIGDNTIELEGVKIVIPTSDFVAQIAASVGFKELERIDISVTTENLVHIRNAIKKNVVLWLQK